MLNKVYWEDLFDTHIRRQLSYAAERSYIVLPVSGANCITYYGVYSRNIMVARCDRLDDAAEVAAALAAYHPQASAMGAISSQSQAGELAPGLAQGDGR